MTQTQRILDVISQFKGITQREIIELTDNPSGINFSARLVGMVNNGLVTREKIHKNNKEVWAYTATGKILNRSRKPKKDDSVKSQKLTNVVSYGQLEIEVQELREFKRLALMIYPDLNITPVIYEARKILAAHYPDQKQKDEILSGKVDKRPPMLAIIQLLENQQ